MTCEIKEGDVLECIQALGSEVFDGCLTDPPYGLKFMGKNWDHGVPSSEVWAELLRTMKPGAFLLAFGGTRTHHRLMCAIEDAGFEIRDVIMWVYGSGFPKSLNIGMAIDKRAGVEREVVGPSNRHPGKTKGGSIPDLERYRNSGDFITAPATEATKLWDGYGTALKPAWEPIIVAMRPCDGTYTDNALKNGVAGLNIDGSRIGLSAGDDPRLGGKGNWATDKAAKNVYEGGYAGNRIASSPLGRWPANIIHDGSNEVTEIFPQSSITGKRTNESKSATVKGTQWLTDNHKSTEYTDSGSAARFFYCAKASKAERGEGNTHPTVKPLALVKYLAGLILPPVRDGQRSIVVPYSGSGSEILGAINAGWDCVVGIEKESEYIKIANNRIKENLPEGPDIEAVRVEALARVEL